MKKLMIAAAIVCAAAVSQAAGWNWNVKTNGDSLYAFDGTKFSGTGYVFEGTDVEAIFEAYVADQSVDFTTLANYAGSVTFTAGETASTFSYGDEQRAYDFTMLAKDAAGNLFIGDAWEDNGYTIMGSGTNIDAGFAWTAEDATREEFSTELATGAYADNGNGMYYTAAVPEPTSGLLLLLGMAGLALRRRRA